MKTYSVETYDNVIPDEFRKEVWDYIQNQSFHATRKNVKYYLIGGGFGTLGALIGS